MSRICRIPGCPNIQPCPAHPARKPFATAQRSNRRLSNSHTWRLVALRYLEANPECVACVAVGIRTQATVVDHIEPHRGDEWLFFAENNLQSLCKRHHDRKTAIEVQNRRKGLGYGLLKVEEL